MSGVLRLSQLRIFVVGVCTATVLAVIGYVAGIVSSPSSAVPREKLPIDGPRSQVGEARPSGPEDGPSQTSLRDLGEATRDTAEALTRVREDVERIVRRVERLERVLATVQTALEKHHADVIVRLEAIAEPQATTPSPAPRRSPLYGLGETREQVEGKLLNRHVNEVMRLLPPPTHRGSEGVYQVWDYAPGKIYFLNWIVVRVELNS